MFMLMMCYYNQLAQGLDGSTLPSILGAPSLGMYCGLQTWTQGGGIGGRISATLSPNFTLRRFASHFAMLSLQTLGKYPQNGAIRDPGGGSKGGFFIKY